EDNLTLFATATKIADAKYHHVSLFFAEGLIDQDNSKDEIALWKFHLSFPKQIGSTILLTYGQGHFLLPIKQNEIIYGKKQVPLMPKLTLTDCLAVTRSSRGGFTEPLQSVEIYQPIYSKMSESIYVFYGKNKQRISIGGNTGKIM